MKTSRSIILLQAVESAGNLNYIRRHIVYTYKMLEKLKKYWS